MLLLFGYTLISVGYVFGEQNGFTFDNFIVTTDNGILMSVQYESSYSPRSLRLTDRELVGIDKDAFKDVGNVISLYLTNNHLTNLPETVFSPLKNLYELNLNDNRLRDLGFMTSLSPTLQFLDLTNNEIMELPPQAFRQLKNLQEIYLTSNNITSLVKESFVGLSGLSALSLDHNQITDIPLQLFNGVADSLTALSLRGNQIQSLKNGTFKRIPTRVLLLSNNKMNEIETASFNLSSLLVLDLRDNFLATFPLDLLHGCPQLYYLNLSRNCFEEMTDVQKSQIRDRLLFEAKVYFR